MQCRLSPRGLVGWLETAGCAVLIAASTSLGQTPPAPLPTPPAPVTQEAPTQSAIPAQATPAGQPCATCAAAAPGEMNPCRDCRYQCKPLCEPCRDQHEPLERPIVSYPASKCFVWKQCEVTETVYDIKVVPREKEIAVPDVVGTERKFSCTECKPVFFTMLKKKSQEELDRKDTAPDMCQPLDKPKLCHSCMKKGKADPCCVTCEACCSEPTHQTCINRGSREREVPVEQFILYPQEAEHVQMTYEFKQKTRKVTVHELVKVPRLITKKIWVKVPICPVPPTPKKCETCGTSAGCEGCAGGVVVSAMPTEAVEVVAEPTEQQK